MKVGVIKLGARVSFSSQGTSGGTGEALSIIRMLKLGGAQPVVFTKILNKDQNPNDIEFRNIEDSFNKTQDLDCLLVINGNVSFYGGLEDRAQLLNYVMINNFPGKVIYALCDPELTLKQVWQLVSKKKWANNWEESQLKITRSDISFLSQPYDVKKVLNSLKKNEVVPDKIVHFPFEKFPCLNEKLPINHNPSVDLSYGGTMRGGKRIKKMIKFYFDMPNDISVEMFGKINSNDFPEDLKFGLREPKFTGPVSYDKMHKKMNEAMAHIVIGDPWYEQINDMAQRAYESIWSSVVTFIDSDLDKLRRVYKKDKLLSNFLYVSDKKEVIDKIRLLKKDPFARKEIINAQFNAINFDAKEYCESFVDQIKQLI